MPTSFSIARLSSVAVLSVIVVLGYVISERLEQYHASIYVSLANFSPPKLWGRDSYVADWQRGNRLDVEASEEFFTSWSAKLKEVPAVNRTIHNKNRRPASVLATAIPHWLEITPFEFPEALMAAEIHKEKFVALGESEPIAFAIRSRGQASRIRISVDDWSRDGEPCEALSSSVRLMLPYRARVNAGKKRVGEKVKPMVLVAHEHNTWTFEKDYTMVVVIDLHAELKSRPGTYTANVILSSDTETLRKIPITIEVLPFNLKVNNFHAGAFGTAWDLWQGGFTGYYPEMIDMDSRYGFNLAGGFFNKGNELRFEYNRAGEMVVDETAPSFQRFDDTMQRMAKHGMGDVLFWNWGGSGKFQQFKNVLRGAGIKDPFETIDGKKQFANLLAAIKNAEILYGWPEMVINPYDEALKDQDATREVIQAIPFVKQKSPTTRLYMTEWREGYTRHYQSSGSHLGGKKRPREIERRKLRASGESVQHNFSVIGANIFDDKSRAIQDEFGGEYWNYASASDLSAATQFSLGFRTWILRAESVLIWANYKGTLENHGWTVHYVLPYDENGRKNRNTRGPVLASARAYAVREGIDDRKYLETLRYLAWQNKSEETWRYLHGLSKRANRLLKNRREIGGLQNTPGVLDNSDSLYEMRLELKNRILDLIN